MIPAEVELVLELLTNRLAALEHGDRIWSLEDSTNGAESARGSGELGARDHFPETSTVGHIAEG
jgi:hypothetical protein